MAWHEDFFGNPLWVRAQREAFGREQSREEARVAHELLQLMPGARVLDVPCGDGRLAVELARRGMVVTAIDRSPALVEAAREAAKGEEVDVVAGDMWALDLPAGHFDGALCWWSSLGYGSEEQDRAFLRGVATALADGAGFVLDLQVAETVLPSFEPRQWFAAGDIVVAEEREYDCGNARIRGHWTLSAPDAREELEVSLRLYTVHELVNLLHSVGFGRFDLYGSHGLEPFELGSERLVCVAWKGNGD